MDQSDTNGTLGQNRVLLDWTRLVMQDGKSIVLLHQPVTDTEDHAGL